MEPLVYPRGPLGSWKTRFCHVSLFFARFVSTFGVLYSAPKGLRTFSLFFCTKCGCTFGLCNSHKNCQKHKRSKRSAPHHRGDTPKVQKDIYGYVSELPAALGELPQKNAHLHGRCMRYLCPATRKISGFCIVVFSWNKRRIKQKKMWTQRFKVRIKKGQPNHYDV